MIVTLNRNLQLQSVFQVKSQSKTLHRNMQQLFSNLLNENDTMHS